MSEQILYHYTDFFAFNGIFRNKELRVNNVLNMNDAAEMKLFMTEIEKAVCNRLSASGLTEKSQRFRAVFHEELSRDFEYSAYAACFSRFRDDAAQWERYGGRGRGICFGVREKLLQKMTGGAVSLETVYYRERLKDHPLVDRITDLVTITDDISFSNDALTALLREAWKVSVSFKHPSFSSEREVRLVVLPFEKSDFDIEPQYHVSHERIKKYYPLDLQKMCLQADTTLEEFVVEIIIGPESTQSLPILQDYLRDNGLEDLASKISYSNCPLRSRG